MTGTTARSIGGRCVGAIGFGSAGLGNRARPDRARAIRLLHTALDAGLRLIDTADVYCGGPRDLGRAERVVGEALRAWQGDRSQVLVASKGGMVLSPAEHATAHPTAKRWPADWTDAPCWWALDGSPESLRRACERSLRALRVEAIGLYQLHAPDPEVPLSESLGALEDLRREGKIEMIGVCNVGTRALEEARSVAVIVSAQNELSPGRQRWRPSVDRCREAGLALLAWSPLGGTGRAGGLAAEHPVFAEVARRRGCSPQRVALAWLLSLGEHVIPIPGARRVETVLDSLAAASLPLSDEDLAQLETLTGSSAAVV